MDNILICTVGLPQSGKSTWARQQGHPIVCPDNIRGALHGHRFIAEAEWAVWGIAKVMVNSLFLSGHDTVILDACNITYAYRQEWAKSKLYDTVYKVFDVDKETCIKRTLTSYRDDLIPIIHRMANNWDDLEPSEEETV